MEEKIIVATPPRPIISEECTNILKAVYEFQSEFEVVGKGKDGYGYKYAPIDVIFEAIQPLLKKYKLVVTHSDLDGEIITTVYHAESGEFIRNYKKIVVESFKGMNGAQAQGSVSTYQRRYSVCELLEITVRDEDSDASPKGHNTGKKPNKGKQKAIQIDDDM